MARLTLIGIVHEIEKSLGLPRSTHQREAAEETSFSAQAGDVLQEGMVRDAVKVIDAEADGGQERAVAGSLPPANLNSVATLSGV